MVRSLLLHPSRLAMATIYRAATHTHSASPPRICHGSAFVPIRTSFAPPKRTYSPKMVGIRCSSTSANEITQSVAEFYDALSGAYEDNWGDHMHHGFFDEHQQPPLPERRAAQIRMIEEGLSFGGVREEEDKRPKSIVDVGCGIGGSARYLAKKYGSSVKGLTNSPLQVERATSLTSAEGLSDKVEFVVGDALNQPFPDGQFDLVWCLESAEHMPDKEKFFSELVRVAAPGGHIIILTVCNRDLLPGEGSLKPDEQELLDKIFKAFYFPAWCSRADYAKMAQSMHLEDIKTADWSKHTALWPEVMKASFDWKAIGGFLKSGWKAMKPMFGTPLMEKAYTQGLVKYTIITARKAT